jgi:polyphosphate kinase 2 (PPK2 family)
MSQRERIKKELLVEPGKQWKFSAADLAERAHWDDYMRAFEAARVANAEARRQLAAEPEAGS